MNIGQSWILLGGWAYQNSPGARLGQGRGRSVGRRCRHISREVVSLRLPCRQVLGRGRDGARYLACGQRLCEKDRSEPSCPTRPSSFVRETMSHSRRRIGTNSIPPRPRFCSDYGALPWLQTADQRSRQRPDRYRTVAPRDSGRPTSQPRAAPRERLADLSSSGGGIGKPYAVGDDAVPRESHIVARHPSGTVGHESSNNQRQRLILRPIVWYSVVL